MGVCKILTSADFAKPGNFENPSVVWQVVWKVCEKPSVAWKVIWNCEKPSLVWKVVENWKVGLQPDRAWLSFARFTYVRH